MRIKKRSQGTHTLLLTFPGTVSSRSSRSSSRKRRRSRPTVAHVAPSSTPKTRGSVDGVDAARRSGSSRRVRHDRRAPSSPNQRRTRGVRPPARRPDRLGTWPTEKGPRRRGRPRCRRTARSPAVPPHDQRGNVGPDGEPVADSLSYRVEVAFAGDWCRWSRPPGPRWGFPRPARRRGGMDRVAARARRTRRRVGTHRPAFHLTWGGVMEGAAPQAGRLAPGPTNTSATALRPPGVDSLLLDQRQFLRYG